MDISDTWDRITPKLFGYLINTLRDKTLAEDMLQATWLKALEALPRFETRGAGFDAWIFAIAHNECRQHWRKQHREVPLDPLLHEQTDPAAASPDRIFVEQVLQSLSEDDRELLRLRYIADLPISDIAQVLNINALAARVRVHRALARARAFATNHNHEQR